MQVILHCLNRLRPLCPCFFASCYRWHEPLHCRIGDLGFLVGHKQQAFENTGLKRNTIAISRVFYNISPSQANEIFSVEPFIMLKIGGVSAEKLVRFQSLNCDWKHRPSTIQTGIFIPGGAARRTLSIRELGDIGWRSRVGQEQSIGRVRSTHRTNEPRKSFRVSKNQDDHTIAKFRYQLFSQLTRSGPR